MCPRPRRHLGRASFAKGKNFREVGLHQCLSERKVEGGPVRSPDVPSHVPSHLQNAAKVRGFSLTASGFTAETDWLLEEAGFEPSVPLRNQRTLRLHSELFDPMIAAHNGRLVKTIGDGFLVEFRSVVDALRCASEVQGCTASSMLQTRPDRREPPHVIEASG